MLFGLPILTWASAFYLRSYSGWVTLPTSLPTLNDVMTSFSWEASSVYLGWIVFQFILYRIVPGPRVRGTRLRDGTYLEYPINGMACLLITGITATLIHIYITPLTWILDNFLELCSASILFSFALSFYLYITSFSRGDAVGNKKKILPPLLAANSGIIVYDFFLGRELNPRALKVDLKYFCELRPGLFAWILIDIAAVLKGGLSPAMIIAVGLQILYVFDALWSEASILTTMDIVMDGFGFMLAFGDLAWVPAMYSLQPRFIAAAAGIAAASHPTSQIHLILCAIVGATGFYIFRSSNAQKDTFKKDPTHPSVVSLPVIRTEAGGSLLAGGWWGAARHVNYAGDLLLALAMSLTTGFVTPVTYFYPIYFAVLLWHRELRDDHKCAAKYGRAWEEYKKRVPYAIFPGVY
jgi:steroid 5-alpha reductase family enzyme